jgi:poly(A) polymerase
MIASDNIIEERQILGKILKFSQIKNIQVWIVGGFLRDIFLGRGRSVLDIDFALKKNAIDFAAGLARRLCAGFVVLDKKNGCARLVKKNQNRLYTLDFTDFRGRNLWEDLRKRDFSINAVAVELKAFLEALSQSGSPKSCIKSFIDPYKGVNDLKAKVIRAISPSVFDDDPLRILRTFSLSCILNFRIEPKTLVLAEQKINKLNTVSFERIRDELFKILSSPRSYEFLLQLDKHRILELIFPEIKTMRKMNQGPYHHLDVWKHTLETLKQLDKIVKNFTRSQDMRDYFNAEISSGRRRYELIKLGAIMHDFGKPKTLRIQEGKIKFHGHERVGVDMLAEVGQRLKLSNDEISVLKKIILLHLRPGYLADNPVLTLRAKFRFFRDAGDEAVSILLVSLADQRATKGYLTTQESRRRHERVVRRLIKGYFEKRKERKPARLINGHDLIKSFKLQPSPLIGKILSEVEEAQAIGKINNKQEALRIAQNVIREGGRR